jgi:hypothetical protein
VTDADQFWRLEAVSAALQSAYQTVFGDTTRGGRAVLMDLAYFCHGYAPTNSEREAGRRDVWLHIQKRLLLRPEELAAIVARLTPEQRIALMTRDTYAATSGG